MPKFIILEEDLERCWLIEAKNKREAIGIAVEHGYAEDEADFHYGLQDGQIQMAKVNKEIKVTQP